MRMLLTLVVAVSAATIVQTRAQDADPSGPTCPTIGLGIEGTVEAVERSPSCRRAYEIMNLCSGGGLSDGPVGGAVREKCERQFLPKYTASQRKVYRRELKHCLDMYAKRSGSLYGSLTAFCQVKNAVRRAARQDRKG
jgi:hypothetical protein